MTTIIIEKQIDAMNKEVYTFWMMSDYTDDITVKLNSRKHMQKETPRHKWKRVGKYYDSHADRTQDVLDRLKPEEVNIPDDVKELLRAEVLKRLVITI